MDGGEFRNVYCIRDANGQMKLTAVEAAIEAAREQLIVPMAQLPAGVRGR